MAATADIITDSATDVLYVPSSSLITQNGSTFAKTLVNGKEVDVAVEAGISSDTNTVITSGLTEGQTVITGITTAASTSSTTTRSVFSTGGFGGGGAVRVQGR
jgi:multidrug efflux pump subunit AcrA (membrane-fusion protein)